MTRSVALIVAIDGPSGVGKSTVARKVAEGLGVPYLDTGAMYRAVALKVLEEKIDPDDESAVEQLLDRTALEVRPLDDGSLEVRLDGEPTGLRLRTPAVDVATSQIATHSAVRAWLVARQREFGQRYGGVVEGRDIGTVVFPDTPHKFYLDAPVEVRAERRRKELVQRGEDVDFDRLLEEMTQRDERDSTRSHSPLRRDDSQQLVDTSEGDAEQVAGRIRDLVRRARSVEPGDGAPVDGPTRE